MNNEINIPAPTTPLVDKNGMLVSAWWQLFLVLFNRTGGPGNAPSVLDLSAAVAAVQSQANDQAVVPENALAQAGARRLDVLEALDQLHSDPSIVRRLQVLEDGLFDRIQPMPAADIDPGMLPPVPALVEGYIAPTLANGWTNAGGSQALAGYYRDNAGVVRLVGVINAGAIGSSAFTLPARYRPAADEVFSVMSNNAAGRVDVTSAGVVTPVVGSNVYVSLSGIAFRAA